MILVELLSASFDWALNSQIFGAPTPYDCPSISAPASTATPSDYFCDNCAGSAFSSIAAAFGTLGYWAQASWLHQIYSYGLSNIIMLAYIFSVIAGIVGFVMGASPRQYIWLFVGPGLFYWLTEYRTAVNGMAWMVAGDQRDQQEVWRMVETGLLNEDYVQRFGFTVSDNAPPSFSGGGALATGEPTPCGQTNGACVSDFFGFFDQVISDTIQHLIGFVGAGRKMHSLGGTGTSIVSNPLSSGTQIYHADLMNDLRWNFFASISEARINNPDLRRSFASFMSSECGDQFLSSVQQDKLHAVKVNQNSPLKTTILESEKLLFGLFDVPTEIKLWSKLTAVVPTPMELKNFIVHKPKAFIFGFSQETNAPGKESNALYFADLLRTAPLKTRAGSVIPDYSPVPPVDEVITCKTFLLLLMQGLRWEAAHTAYQIMNNGPRDMSSLDYVSSMLYGMDIKYPPDLIGVLPGYGFEPAGTQIKVNHVAQFVEALVLAKIFSNELQVSPAVAAQMQSVYSAPVAEKNIQDIKQFQRVNNQFSKFGELYTWAQMVPYFQGQLLYYLAIAYPFAAMFVVIPGMFKGFLQWCQFWIWVKLWDLGFAMVAVLERSVWSITGGGAKNGDFNTLILQIAGVNGANGTNICEAVPQTTIVPPFLPFVANKIHHTKTIPNVAVDPYYTMASTTAQTDHGNGIFYMQWMLDRLLAASGNIGLNMANTYYIYIMSALYLSVPVICGTLVLGAKSGMASMLGSTMGGIASPAGGAASNAATGNYTKALGSNQATFGQEQFAKSLRSGAAAGFAKQALDAQNLSTAEQMSGSFVGARSQALGGLSGVLGNEMSAQYSNYQAAMQGGQMLFGMAESGGMAWGKARAMGLKESSGGMDGPQVSSSSASGASSGASSTSGGPLGDVGKMGGTALGTGSRFLANYGGLNNMAAMREMATTSMAAIAQLSAAQQGLNVASAGHQTKGAQAGLQGQRLNEVADFAGREEQWRARDNVAQSGMASEVAAITGSTGMVASGEKPQSASAMAYMGRMEGGTIGAGGGFKAYGGHGSAASARAANAGGSLDRHRSAGMADLKANYGSDFVAQGAKGGAIDPDKAVRDASYERALAQTWKAATPVVKGFQDGVMGRMADPMMGAAMGQFGSELSAAGQGLIDQGQAQKAQGNHKVGDQMIAAGQFGRDLGRSAEMGAHYSESGNIVTDMKPGAQPEGKRNVGAIVAAQKDIEKNAR